MEPYELKQNFFKLAHFDPTCQDDYGYQVIDYLVLDALAVFGPLLVVTSREIKENIQKSFHVVFEEAEINASAKRLGNRGLIEYIEPDNRTERPRIQILAETKEQISNNVAEIRGLEDNVIDSWKNGLLAKYAEYPLVAEKVKDIVNCLQLFLTRILIKHGVECVALLYPEDQKTKQWIQDVKGAALEGLPTIDPFVYSVVQLEIPLFFQSPDSQRQYYISSVFNSSFFWHLVQVDQKLSRLLKDVTRGQRLYLDNNILYGLVGLGGSAKLNAVHSMLRIAKELGYDLWVTTKSIDEFHESLRWNVEQLRQRPSLPSELARIAVENLEVDSFVTLYWKSFVRNGISIEEFYSERSHLDEILGGLDIQITNKFRRDIDKSDELIDEMSILRSVAVAWTSEHIIEHDAYHRVFINKIRKSPKYSFTDATAWFLTDDSKLPVYDQVARKGKNYLPFCITSNHWIQINRPLLTRTANQAEYERSFHVLVTQPFLRSMIAPFNLERAYNEVLGRLTRYQDMNPEFARSLVADRHFMITVAQEEDSKKIDELIESQFVDLANVLQSKKDKLAQELENERINKKSTIEELNTRITLLEKKADEERERRSLEVTSLTSNLQAEKEKRKEVETEAQNIKEDFHKFKTGTRNWAISILLIFSTSAILWLLPYQLSWIDIDNYLNRFFLQLSVQLMVISLILIIPLRQHWKWLVGLAATFFVLFISLAS